MTFGSTFGRTFSPTFQPKSVAGGLNIFDTFTRSNGGLNGSTTEDGGFAWSCASSWTISSNSVISNPTLGSELVKNGTFDSDTEWTKGNGWSISGGVANYAAGSGNTYLTQTSPNTTRNKLIYSSIDKSVNNLVTRVGNIDCPLTGGSPYTWFTSSNNDSVSVMCGPWGATTIDNFSAKAFSFSDIFAGIDTGVSDVTVSASISTTNRGLATGLVLNLDSISNPQNFVVVFPCQNNSGTNRIFIVKFVNGVYGGAVNYSSNAQGANKVLAVTKTGTDYTVVYDNGTVVSSYSVTDASIKDNTIHGMFSVNTTNLINSISITG